MFEISREKVNTGVQRNVVRLVDFGQESPLKRLGVVNLLSLPFQVTHDLLIYYRELIIIFFLFLILRIIIGRNCNRNRGLRGRIIGIVHTYPFTNIGE
jgi:hypothetical protein